MPAQISDQVYFSGLKKSEIQTQLKQFGKNVLGPVKHRGFLNAIWNIFKEPMFLMLVFAATLYFVLGESDEGLQLSRWDY